MDIIEEINTTFIEYPEQGTNPMILSDGQIDTSIYREFIFQTGTNLPENIKIVSQYGNPNGVVSIALTKIIEFFVNPDYYLNIYKYYLLESHSNQHFARSYESGLFYLKNAKLYSVRHPENITSNPADAITAIDINILDVSTAILGTARNSPIYPEYILIVNLLFKLLIDMHNYFKIVNNDIVANIIKNIIIKVLLTLDTKSLSDTLQCNALLFYGLSENLIARGPYNPINLPNTILYDGKLTDNVDNLVKIMYGISEYMKITDLFFVTSDLLAAGVSSLITDKIIISTKKSSSGLLTIFTLSKELSFISCLIGNTVTNLKLILQVIPDVRVNETQTLHYLINSMLDEIHNCKKKLFNIHGFDEETVELYLDGFITKNLEYMYLYSADFNDTSNYYQVIEKIMKRDDIYITSCKRLTFLLNNITLFIFINNLTTIIKNFSN